MTPGEKTAEVNRLARLSDEELSGELGQTLTGVVPSPSIEVPEGSVKDVLSWVGDDPLRAQAALRAEAAKPEAERRKTLLDALT